MARTEDLVDAIDRALSRALARRRVAVAWSCGLASTLVATVARKRVDIVCYCVGGRNSRDRRAAREGAQILDLGLRELDGRPRTPAEAVEFVRKRAGEDLVLTGETRATASRTRERGIVRPLLDSRVRRHGGGTRAALAAGARFVGLPERIAAARHRGPGA